MSQSPPLNEKVPIRSAGQGKIINACEKHWNAHKNNCSGFVNAVADQLSIQLPHMQANPMIDYVSSWTTPSWWKISTPAEAGSYAEKGYLVIACLKLSPNGHVAVVTSGHEPGHGIYPRGYWGTYQGVGKMNSTINYSFRMDLYRHKILYFRCMQRQ